MVMLLMLNVAFVQMSVMLDVDDVVMLLMLDVAFVQMLKMQ